MADETTPQNAPSGSTTSGAPSRTAARVWDIYFPPKGGVHRESVYVASFPPILYFWPTILTAFFAAFLQGVAGVDGAALGWCMIGITMFNFLVLVQDFDQKQFVILVLGLLATGLGIWVVTLLGFHFLGAVFGFLGHFSPAWSVDAYVVFGTSLLLLFLWGMLTPLFSYWELEANEFVHFTRPVGRDMSIARTGCTVYKEIPDIFEYLLSAGGGALVIKRDGQVVANIPNVPFLSRRMQAIEHMLSETRVVVEQSR